MQHHAREHDGDAGYREPSTPTTLSSPRPAASTNSRLASRSNTPTAAIAARAAGAVGSLGRTTAHATSRISTSAVRAESSTHATSPVSSARSIPAKNEPKPTAASSARPIATRPLRRVSGSSLGASLDARMTPAHASPMPATCSAPGRSPDASPTSTGIETPVAEIGATTLIVPIESAR